MAASVEHAGDEPVEKGKDAKTADVERVGDGGRAILSPAFEGKHARGEVKRDSWGEQGGVSASKAASCSAAARNAAESRLTQAKPKQEHEERSKKGREADEIMQEACLECQTSGGKGQEGDHGAGFSPSKLPRCS